MSHSIVCDDVIAFHNNYAEDPITLVNKVGSLHNKILVTFDLLKVVASAVRTADGVYFSSTNSSILKSTDSPLVELRQKDIKLSISGSSIFKIVAIFLREYQNRKIELMNDEEILNAFL